MKRLARLVLLLGAAGGAWYFLDAHPRSVDLVYDVEGVTGATRLVVEISGGASVLRRAEFRRPAGQVRHRVRLPDGRYALAWTLDGPGGALAGERALEVEGEQTVVLRLGP